jgi:hypothetical protein
MHIQIIVKNKIICFEKKKEGKKKKRGKKENYNSKE